MLALSTFAGTIIMVLGVIFIAAAGVAISQRGRTRTHSADIPRAMRPGPSDPALETPLLQKLQGWGVLLVAFFVIWVPFVWLREPSVNLQQEKDLKTAAIARASAPRSSTQRRTSWGSGACAAMVPSWKAASSPTRAATPIRRTSRPSAAGTSEANTPR